MSNNQEQTKILRDILQSVSHDLVIQFIKLFCKPGQYYVTNNYASFSLHEDMDSELYMKLIDSPILIMFDDRYYSFDASEVQEITNLLSRFVKLKAFI